MELTMEINLDQNLKSLRMPAILKNYSRLASLALEEKLSYEQYLFKLTSKEVEDRFSNRVNYLLKGAKFPKTKTLDDFSFTGYEFTKESVLELCRGHFLSDHINLILFGTPGSGKTHLAMAIGRELCIKGKKILFHTGCSIIQELVKAKNSLTLTNYFKKMSMYDLVIIDELGYIPFEKSEADLLFQFISDRYEKKSLLITTNLAFSEWDKVFKDQMVANATIDRLIHYSVVFKFQKEVSYRTEQAKKKIVKK
jgi:DNA replication protein DnaC